MCISIIFEVYFIKCWTDEFEIKIITTVSHNNLFALLTLYDQI